MTKLLAVAIAKARHLPDEMRDMLTRQLLEDIESVLSWTRLAGAYDLLVFLVRLGCKAHPHRLAGRTSTQVFGAL